MMSNMSPRVTSDEIINSGERQPSGGFDRQSAASPDLALKMDPRAYARKQFDDPSWPVGLCIAWIVAREEAETIRFFASNLADWKGSPVEGWISGQTSLLRALKAGRIEGSGRRSEGGPRVSIARHEWIDLRILKRGLFDLVAAADGAVAYSMVRIDKGSVLREWPVEAPSASAGRQKRKRERACLDALKERMVAKPTEPTAKRKLRSEFPDVSERAFNQLFTKAARESGAVAWRAAGRRRRQPTD
jgi:hypothetical protein